MRFDACAESYDAYAVPQRVFAERVAAFTGVLPRERVVEFGAGTGALTRHVCDSAQGQVLATDASAAMVALGRKAVSGVQWSQLDAFGGSVPASDLQLSSGLLQWADEPVRVLQLWRTALEPGGRMVHAFPCEPCLREWRALVPAAPVRWRDEKAWCEVFRAAGLQPRRRQTWIETIVFTSALDMLRAMHRSGATGRARVGTGELRRALRDYEVRHRGPAGVLATWAWLAIEAVPGIG